MAFSYGDQENSYIAIFVLLIIWFFTFIPRMFYSYAKTDYEDDEGNKVKLTRASRANAIARDGVLLLLVNVTEAFSGRGDEGTTSALSWIFFAIWVIVIILSYLIDSKIILSLLQLLGILIIIANLIVTYSTASGRYAPFGGKTPLNNNG